MIKLGEPSLVLAPMDGVTDAFMRRLLTSWMPFTYCVTEFIRVSQHVPPARVFTREAPELANGAVTASGVSVGVQLLGGDPERLALAALEAVKAGAKVIDLNFGCPAPTVNRHDGGATLLRHPCRIESIVSAVRSALPVSVPLSAKLRLGWDDPGAIYENTERAVRGGVSWITIHGRTKMQGYTPPAYWRPIGEVRRAVGVPVVANGEIWSLDDLKLCQEQSGCEHFMLGRGALASPELVSQCANYLNISQRSTRLPGAEGGNVWIAMMGELLRASRSDGEGDRRSLSRVKQWLNYAHKRGTCTWFDRIKRARDTLELERELALLSEGAATVPDSLAA